MKVALFNVTTTTKTGGVESFVWELARYLTANYADCQVDIIGGVSPKKFHAPTLDPRIRVITRPFVARESLRKIPLLNRLYGQTKLLERLTFGLSCLSLFARERYDIIHIQKPYDLPIAQLAGKLFGAKILFGCHGKDFFPGDTLFAKNLPAVSCSRYNAGIVEAHFGIEPVVVYNGIDIDLFSPRPVKAELRNSLAAPEEFVIMHVGRQVRWKGAQYLIQALGLLHAKDLPVKLLLAGDGPYKKELEAQAHRSGVAESVLFLGNVPNRDLPDYYALSDIIVGTSFANETFGIALAEASACERPIVASDFGGFKEVVVAEETGLFYHPQDARELAAQLERLLLDPEGRRRMGQTGRQFVVENFSWPAVARRVYSEYQTLLNSKN